MDSLLIEGTLNTPSVRFEHSEGLLEIKGRSICEDACGFYEPIIHWIEEYKKNPNEYTTVNIHLEYFNSSSAKNIFHALKKIVSIPEAKEKVTINWYYDAGDEEMFINGSDYESLIYFPVEKIEI
jgi:hypothetical protein